MHTEITGDILSVRAVEDCIRATQKYSKILFRKSAQHPIQGEEFPSQMLTEHYEVFPDMEIGMNMSLINAVFWLAGETPHIRVTFRYNYPLNKGWVLIRGGNGATKALERGIPKLTEALEAVRNSNGRSG